MNTQFRTQKRRCLLCFSILLTFCSVCLPMIAAARVISLGSWSEYDPASFGAGIQTLSNNSTAGFTAAHDGSVSGLQERPRVYQEFDGVDVSQVGQKLTATFDVQFHTVPSAGDTVFRFGFGDRTTNQGLVPMMVDLGQSEGVSVRQRYDDSLTDGQAIYTPGDYSGFLSASSTFGAATGNPTSNGSSIGVGGIRDVVAVHSFTVTVERVERNVDTSFPADGIADELVNGWYTTLSWTSNELGAGTVFADTNNNTFAQFDVDTGLGVFNEDIFNARGRIENIDTVGFYIFQDDPFAATGSIGSYTVSNFALRYNVPEPSSLLLSAFLLIAFASRQHHTRAKQ